MCTEIVCGLNAPIPVTGAGEPKGALACEAIPKVEGGGSGQAAGKKFGEAQILCIFSPISA
jgi:hypothetical protein